MNKPTLTKEQAEIWKVAVIESLMKGIDPEDIVKLGERGVFGGRK